MWFWTFMLIMDLLIPVVMIAFGKLFMNKTPGNINHIFGYRSSMSMKNKDTWDFAHKYCGRLWFLIGWIILPLSVIPFLFIIGKDTETVGMVGTIVCVVQLLPLIGAIIPTEIALRKTFDENGNRR